MGYAFISYSSKRKEEAEKIKRILKNNNVDVWMAPESIPLGKKYAQVITKGVRECSCVVLVLTEEAQNSDGVESEVELAIDFKKTVIMIKIGDFELNDSYLYYVKRFHFVTVEEIVENSFEMKSVLDSVLLNTKPETKATNTVIEIKNNNTPYEDVIKTEKNIEEKNIEEKNIEEKNIEEKPTKNIRVNQNSCDDSVIVRKGDIITAGKYPQNNDYPEPIEWIVLDVNESEALVIGKYSICYKEYSRGSEVEFEKSNLIFWLNSFFFDKAFSEYEKIYIKKDKALNRVFILSQEEAEMYFESPEKRRAYATKKSNENFSRDVFLERTLFKPYWLRTSNFSGYNSVVDDKGNINIRGIRQNRKAFIRPAMRVNITMTLGEIMEVRKEIRK